MEKVKEKPKVTPPRRRYKIGRHKQYDGLYDRMLLDSPIINYGGGDHSPMNSAAWVSKNSPGSVRQALGRKREQYNDLEKELEEMTARNHAKAEAKILEGYESGIDENLLEKQLKLEVWVDVLKLELDTLKKWQEEITAGEQEEQERKFLENGPTGSAKLTGGVVAEIAGQRCAVVNGFPTIIEDDSPYKGMKAIDYKNHVAVPYMQTKLNLKSAKTRFERGEITAEEYQKKKEKIMHDAPGHIFSLNFKGKKIPAWPQQVEKNE